jgi:hypothetical protein
MLVADHLLATLRICISTRCQRSSETILHSGTSTLSSVRFNPDELKELNASVSSIQIQGKRLPDGVLAFSGVEAATKR